MPMRTTGFEELTRVGVKEVVRILATPGFGAELPKYEARTGLGAARGTPEVPCVGNAA